MNSPDSPLLAGTSLKPSHRGKPQERSTTIVFVMATVNHMKISWYIFVLIYFLQQVQPQATESDTTSSTVLSVTEEETTAAAKEDVKSQATTQETPMTATAAQENMETTAAEASEPSGVTSDPAGSTQLSEGNTTNGNSTLDGDAGTTVASHMSEGDNQTSQTPADLMASSQATGNKTHGNNATTEGESAEMTTAAMPSTCYSCNDTDCNNSSNWQTCTTTGGCSITFLKKSKTILLSCTKSCRGPFPNGQFTASECGFCCMGAYCNNYTAAAAETACINMAGSGTSGMEIYPAVFLLCAIVQMILIQK